MSIWDKARAEVARRNAAQLPVCDWVYFATPKPASFRETRTLVRAFGLIIRNVINSGGDPIPNVGRLRVGDRILLVHGEGQNYRPMFGCTVIAPRRPVPGFPACSSVDENEAAPLQRSGYSPDPRFKCFTGIAADPGPDLDDALPSVARPGSLTTLRRWEAVFPGLEVR